MHTLNIWTHYLVARKFELKENHHGLQYTFMQSELNALHRRWIELLNKSIPAHHLSKEP